MRPLVASERPIVASCGLRGISVIPLCVTAPRGGEAAPVPAVFQRLLQSSLENQCIPVIVSDVSDESSPYYRQ